MNCTFDRRKLFVCVVKTTTTTTITSAAVAAAAHTKTQSHRRNFITINDETQHHWHDEIDKEKNVSFLKRSNHIWQEIANKSIEEITKWWIDNMIRYVMWFVCVHCSAFFYISHRMAISKSYSCVDFVRLFQQYFPWAFQRPYHLIDIISVSARTRTLPLS